MKWVIYYQKNTAEETPCSIGKHPAIPFRMSLCKHPPEDLCQALDGIPDAPATSSPFQELSPGEKWKDLGQSRWVGIPWTGQQMDSLCGWGVIGWHHSSRLWWFWVMGHGCFSVGTQVCLDWVASPGLGPGPSVYHPWPLSGRVSVGPGGESKGSWVPSLDFKVTQRLLKAEKPYLLWKTEVTFHTPFPTLTMWSHDNLQ